MANEGVREAIDEEHGQFGINDMGEKVMKKRKLSESASGAVQCNQPYTCEKTAREPTSKESGNVRRRTVPNVGGKQNAQSNSVATNEREGCTLEGMDIVIRKTTSPQCRTVQTVVVEKLHEPHGKGHFAVREEVKVLREVSQPSGNTLDKRAQTCDSTMKVASSASAKKEVKKQSVTRKMASNSGVGTRKPTSVEGVLGKQHKPSLIISDNTKYQPLLDVNGQHVPNKEKHFRKEEIYVEPTKDCYSGDSKKKKGKTQSVLIKTPVQTGVPSNTKKGPTKLGENYEGLMQFSDGFYSDNTSELREQLPSRILPSVKKFRKHCSQYVHYPLDTSIESQDKRDIAPTVQYSANNGNVSENTTSTICTDSSDGGKGMVEPLNDNPPLRLYHPSLVRYGEHSVNKEKGATLKQNKDRLLCKEDNIYLANMKPTTTNQRRIVKTVKVHTQSASSTVSNVKEKKPTHIEKDSTFRENSDEKDFNGECTEMAKVYNQKEGLGSNGNAAQKLVESTICAKQQTCETTKTKGSQYLEKETGTHEVMKININKEESKVEGNNENASLEKASEREGATLDKSTQSEKVLEKVEKTVQQGIESESNQEVGTNEEVCSQFSETSSQCRRLQPSRHVKRKLVYTHSGIAAYRNEMEAHYEPLAKVSRKYGTKGNKKKNDNKLNVQEYVGVNRRASGNVLYEKVNISGNKKCSEKVSNQSGKETSNREQNKTNENVLHERITPTLNKGTNVKQDGGGTGCVGDVMYMQEKGHKGKIVHDERNVASNPKPLGRCGRRRKKIASAPVNASTSSTNINPECKKNTLSEEEKACEVEVPPTGGSDLDTVHTQHEVAPVNPCPQPLNEVAEPGRNNQWLNRSRQCFIFTVIATTMIMSGIFIVWYWFPAIAQEAMRWLRQ